MLLQFFLVLAHSAWRALDIELSEFSVTSTNIYYSIEVLEQYEICTMFYTIFYKYTGVEPIFGQILISFYLGMLKVFFFKDPPYLGKFYHKEPSHSVTKAISTTYLLIYLI